MLGVAMRYIKPPSLISGYGFSSVLMWMRQLETAQDSTSERTYRP